MKGPTHKNVHLKTQWASHTMHLNLAVILQFNYGQNNRCHKKIQYSVTMMKFELWLDVANHMTSFSQLEFFILL